MAPGVAHEHRGSALRPQVEREEAAACEPERDREREDRLVLVRGQRVDRKVRARDDRERRREAVHVVEEVEGVGDADEPEQADRPRDDVVADQLDVEAAREDDDGRGDLGGELRDRAQVPEVVDEPGDEDDRDTGEDAAELAGPLDDPRRERDGDPGGEAGEDPDSAEESASAARASLSPVGTATSRAPTGERRRSQRTAAATENAAIATIAFTIGEG